MAAARARQQDAPRARETAPPRPRIVPRTAASRASGIRWDRLSRVTLLIVIVGLALLYVGPARSYLSTRHEAADKRAAVAKLKRENLKLKSRAAALRDPASLEREARRLGMVRKGDRAYVVKGLPKGP